MFTDGSKRKREWELLWCGEGVRGATLPKEASIFSAEAHAISMAVRIAEESQETKFVIFSDSDSVVRSLANVINIHPVCRKFVNDMHNFGGKAR